MVFVRASLQNACHTGCVSKLMNQKIKWSLMRPESRLFDENTTPVLDFHQAITALAIQHAPFPRRNADSSVMPRSRLIHRLTHD